LILFEAFKASGGTIFANKKIIHHKWNQFSQLVANAGLMVPTETASTQKFYNVQIAVLATVTKQKRTNTVTNNVLDKSIIFLTILWPFGHLFFTYSSPNFKTAE
jgi:hypothetical protein